MEEQIETFVARHLDAPAGRYLTRIEGKAQPPAGSAFGGFEHASPENWTLPVRRARFSDGL